MMFGISIFLLKGPFHFLIALSLQDITETGDLGWNFDRYYIVSRTGDVTFYEGNTPMGLESVVQYYLDEVPDL